MPTATRTYKNDNGDILRLDNIIMEPTSGTLSSGTESRTWSRRLTKQLQHGFLDRVVATIEFITDADRVDTGSWPSAYSDYTWAEWDWDSQVIRCNMSDLPKIGDTV